MTPQGIALGTVSIKNNGQPQRGVPNRTNATCRNHGPTSSFNSNAAPLGLSFAPIRGRNPFFRASCVLRGQLPFNFLRAALRLRDFASPSTSSFRISTFAFRIFPLYLRLRRRVPTSPIKPSAASTNADGSGTKATISMASMFKTSLPPLASLWIIPATYCVDENAAA